MRKLLLTGASGFIGQHLHGFLKNQFQIFAPTLAELDLQDLNALERMARLQPWDVVIHLAGISHVVECEKDPARAQQINARATEHLAGMLSAQSSPCHFIFASTAQVYKAPEGEEVHSVLFDEKRAVGPQNFYAETKAQAERAIQTASQKGLRATVLRLFNHTHKSQAPSFFLPHIYNQLLQGATRIPVGNLDLERDMGSVHDLTRAFAAVIEKCDWKFEVFNVCSGTPKNLRRLIELLSQKMDRTAEFVTDPSRVRANEPHRIVGSHQKLTERTGWQPKVRTEEDLIEDFLCG